MNFDQTSEFKRDLKSLAKKWRSLPEDLATAQKVIENLYVENPDMDIAMYRKAFFDGKRATILHSASNNKGQEVVKMRLDCASLTNKEAVRLIFVCIKAANTITFIELFSKTNKQREDQSRIKPYL